MHFLIVMKRLPEVCGSPQENLKLVRSLPRLTRAVPNRRVGTEINIVEAGTEIRVHYVVDSQGRTIVRGIQCGSEALVSDILAHANVVRLLNRYDGVTGRLRQVWDRLLSLAGRPNANVVNPFRPGSMAFESWSGNEKTTRYN